MDLSSMQPSSWNGVGAIAKVPAALWVSFVIGASIQLRSLRSPHLTQNLTSGEVRSLSRWERIGVSGYGLSLHHIPLPGAEPVPGRRRSADPGAPTSPFGRGDSKAPRARLDLFLGKENLLGVFDNILRLPSGVWRLPARLFHHPHLTHAARAGNAEDFARLVARQIAHHV